MKCLEKREKPVDLADKKIIQFIQIPPNFELYLLSVDRSVLQSSLYRLI